MGQFPKIRVTAWHCIALHCWGEAGMRLRENGEGVFLAHVWCNRDLFAFCKVIYVLDKAWPLAGSTQLSNIISIATKIFCTSFETTSFTFCWYLWHFWMRLKMWFTQVVGAISSSWESLYCKQLTQTITKGSVPKIRATAWRCITLPAEGGRRLRKRERKRQS